MGSRILWDARRREVRASLATRLEAERRRSRRWRAIALARKRLQLRAELERDEAATFAGRAWAACRVLFGQLIVETNRLRAEADAARWERRRA